VTVLRERHLPALVRSVVDKGQREIRRMESQTGDCLARETAGSGFQRITVHLDGDPPGHGTPVIVVSGTVNLHSRVTVFFTPPAGAIAIGHGTGGSGGGG
jgi:hypothetical protein